MHLRSLLRHLVSSYDIAELEIMTPHFVDTECRTDH